MTEWWNALDMALKILYCVTVPATVVLIIQTVLMIIGFGDSGAGIDTSDVSGLDLSPDADMDIDADAMSAADALDMQDGGNPADFSAMHLLTLQTVIAFLTVFGWSAITSLSAGGQLWLSLLIGAALGFAAMLLIAKLVQLSSRLAENGTAELKNALGESAVVYLPVPAAGEGYGKVTLTLQGSFTECEAVSFEPQPLSVGTTVRVIDVRENVLVVERER